MIDDNPFTEPDRTSEAYFCQRIYKYTQISSLDCAFHVIQQPTNNLPEKKINTFIKFNEIKFNSIFLSVRPGVCDLPEGNAEHRRRGGAALLAQVNFYKHGGIFCELLKALWIFL